MRLERLADKEHEMYKAALELYRISFPPHEQRKAESQEKILKDKEYFFRLAYDEDTFVGMVLCWETEGFIYIEHFCILPQMRNKRYGQKVLELLCQGEKTVILEIDPPVDDISLRRRDFYRRCGFAENPYAHIHPPYHEGNHGHDLKIMSFPKTITQAEYSTFKDYLDTHVMKDVF